MMRPMMRTTLHALPAALALLLAGCNLAPTYQTPQLPVPEAALTALMRRLAMLATASGRAEATFVADTAHGEFVLTLHGAAHGDAAAKRMSPPQSPPP